MKTNHIFILFGISIAGMMSSCRDESISSNSNDSDRQELKPHELMLMERSYPDDVFPYEVYKRSMLDAHFFSGLSADSRNDESWEVEGPGNIGGRFNCLAIDQENSQVMYAGAATGGIFKTTNGGLSWIPVFDEQPFLSIGAITIDPSNNDVIWAGTGDANISGFCYVGDGIYKSEDGGITWEHKGLSQQYVISKIIVSPLSPDTIYAAAMGLPFERDDFRGLYKSTDGGDSWNQVLFTSDESGVIDLVMNMDNPQVLYAATYNRIRNNHEIVASGEDCKIWKTIDGGVNWTHLTVGLPEEEVGRIGLAMYQESSDTLYAVIADTSHYVQGVYYSMNGGDDWNEMELEGLDQSVYSGFGWYFGKIYVNPEDYEQVYVLGVDVYTTTNLGETWTMLTPPWWMYEVHADSHYMNFLDGDNYVLCTDGGIYRTEDNGDSWEDIDNIPVNQVYHAISHPFYDNTYLCGVQDNGTSTGSDLVINDWERIYGGDGFQPRIHPEDPYTIFAETQYGGLVASVDGGYSFFGFTDGIDPADRVNWDMPYIISSGDPGRMYCATYRVYRTTGAPFFFWQTISDDLTDGLDEELEMIHTITCIDESEINNQVLFAGTADANVWRTIDAGNSWNNITGDLPERYVTSIETSPNDENTVYVTHSGYRDNEYIPHVHRSEDNGNSWEDISGNLPQVAVNDILIASGAGNVLFVATDDGVYSTINGGLSWNRLGNNMPMMPVFDIEFNSDQTILVASTFARSVQTIDVSTLISAGINRPDEEIVFDIFPNPVTDLLQLRNDDAQSRWSIYDSSGKRVLFGETNSNLTTINVEHLTHGTYILVLNSGDRQRSEKFIRSAVN